MKIFKATRKYGSWLRAALNVFEADLALKAQLHAKDQFTFLRGLAPDRCRIELSELRPERDETRMMRAMGWETANIHLGTRPAVKDVLSDLKGRKPNWLRRSTEKMVTVTLKDWEMWKTGNVS